MSLLFFKKESAWNELLYCRNAVKERLAGFRHVSRIKWGNTETHVTKIESNCSRMKSLSNKNINELYTVTTVSAE
jgi:hypothetical protein